MHFSGLDVEVDAVEGPDSGERLGDAGHGEQRWFWCHEVPLAGVRAGFRAMRVRGQAGSGQGRVKKRAEQSEVGR
ncbi:hypothetical protein SGFS_029240 [Streptomyces graminofaciens]|uniref:Uncharacterized protein n=1 Tax=Streptomyces graminofaciens TaxID=68212 RepID=A0ABM7F6U7_9ACTN|nr:hypothetical protein SGFS_029240 [Streptomyces graminofaciens]